MSQNEWKTTEIRAWQSWECLALFLPRQVARRPRRRAAAARGDPHRRDPRRGRRLPRAPPRRRRPELGRRRRRRAAPPRRGLWLRRRRQDPPRPRRRPGPAGRPRPRRQGARRRQLEHGLRAPHLQAPLDGRARDGPGLRGPPGRLQRRALGGGDPIVVRNDTDAARRFRALDGHPPLRGGGRGAPSRGAGRVSSSMGLVFLSRA